MNTFTHPYLHFSTHPPSPHILPQILHLSSSHQALRIRSQRLPASSQTIGRLIRRQSNLQGQNRRVAALFGRVAASRRHRGDGETACG